MQKISHLPKRVILVGWISFFADISSEMIYPLVPLFLVGVLGSTALTLGAIEGLAQAIVSVMSLFSGALSDRVHKRVRFIQWGYGLPILGKGLLAFATTWQLVLTGRAIDRLGKGLRGSPRDALIAESVESNQRGAAFGFHRMMDTVGAFVGVLIAAFALKFLGGDHVSSAYRIVFFVAAVLAVCSFVISLVIDDPSSQAHPSSHPTHSERREPIWAQLSGLGREYWTTLCILALFAFANSSDAFLLLKAADVGLTPVEVVLIYALYNFTYATFSYYAGKLSDRLGRWKIITVGWIIYAFVYLGIAVATSHYLWPLFALYGVYIALTEGVSKALIIDCAPAHKKGTALGLLYLTLGCSAISSNLLAGYLWDSVTKSSPFFVGAGFAALAVITVWICDPESRSSA